MSVSEILENRSPLVVKPDQSQSSNTTEKVDVSDSLVIQDSLDVKAPRENTINNEQRLEINRAIETTNIATRAVDDISRLLDGIQGIVEQAQDQKVPEERIKILEKEAEDLRQEIFKSAEVQSESGSKPLSGDPIRVKVEQTLGKALEVILPDDAKKAFGLSDIKLSPKEVIINTITSIERARQGIEKLRSGIQDGTTKLKDTLAALEVAKQNREASQTLLRDVENALDLSNNTKKNIRENPSSALDSFGEIKNAAIVLQR